MKTREWMWKDMFMTLTIIREREIFEYDQDGLFCLCVAKVEIKEYRKITGKHFPVFDYIGLNFHHRYLQKINLKIIYNNKEAYFVVVAIGQKDENRQYMDL